jgi:phosphatidylinositol dimannoside acyltransferase
MAPYYAYRAAEAVVHALPHRTAHRLAVAMGRTTATLFPRRFDGLRANLRRVVPEADELTLRRLVRANAGNLMRCWVDLMEMDRRADEVTARVHPADAEHILGPQEEGRGVVCISVHLGSWQLGLAGWNRRFGRMAVLAEVLRPRPLFERIVAARTRLGIEVIPLDVATMRASDPESARRLGAAALREVYRILRGAGMVAMAIDRDLTGTGEPLAFFGAPARIPVGVVEVAIRTGAAVVPVVLLREHEEAIGQCYPEVRYDPAAERGAEVRRVASEVLRVFERVIREHPDQWHVLDALWTAPAPASGRLMEAAAGK